MEKYAINSSSIKTDRGFCKYRGTIYTQTIDFIIYNVLNTVNLL